MSQKEEYKNILLYVSVVNCKMNKDFILRIKVQTKMYDSMFITKKLISLQEYAGNIHLSFLLYITSIIYSMVYVYNIKLKIR